MQARRQAQRMPLPFPRANGQPLAWLAPGMPGANWVTPESVWKGYRQERFRNWRNRWGGQYAEDYFCYSTPVANIAPGATATLNFTIAADSTFEWIATTFTNNPSVEPGILNYGGNLTLQVTDGGSSRNLFHTPLNIQECSGDGALPLILPIPRRFLSKSQVNVYITNFDTAITYENCILTFIGRKIFSDRNQQNFMGEDVKLFKSWIGNNGILYAEDYFGYGFNVATLAAGATNVSTVTMEADSDFEWILTSSSALRNATTGQALNDTLVTWQILDGSTGRNLFSNPTYLGQNTGDAGLPFINPISRIFVAKTPVTVTFQNLDTVAVNNIWLVMQGRKIFQVDHE
jgi:hypothetical protein